MVLSDDWTIAKHDTRHYIGRRAVDREARTRDALAALGDGASGTVVLAVVAAGLVAYGAYEAVQARYRHINARESR